VVVNEVETRDARGSEKTGGIHPGTWPMLVLEALHVSDVASPRMDHMGRQYPFGALFTRERQRQLGTTTAPNMREGF
jgi:hypothetical protein